MESGLFIVLEGIDGAGTTTQTARLARWLRESGRKVASTREPSTGPVGGLLRQLLGGTLGPLDPVAMALLFAADRMDHLAREIEPALASGACVLSDRYYLSSAAYQSQSVDRDLILRFNERARTPDLTVLLAVPAEVGEARRAGAGRDVELFDALELQRRVAAAYEDLARRPPRGERVVRLDGTAPPDDVERELRRLVGPLAGLAPDR